jgi:X-X-X-Leu-X-X-Gly heptad repeat protein
VRQAAGSAASGAGRLASGAYDAASDTTTGELIEELILGGIGLSLFYLFLTRAAAAGKLFQGATNVVHAVVSPTVDPLNPKGALS